LIYVVVLLLVTWLVAVAAGLTYQWIGIRRDATRFPPPGRLVQVGRHRLHLFEMGQGVPPVILEAGISATCVNWRQVQTEVAKFTRVLAYDRAGLGWSDTARTPRTATQMVEELHDMLRAAAIPAPYILVGHSFGGLMVRLYACRYPDEVAGIVLVDPLRPGEWHPISAEQRRMLAGGAFLSHWGGLLARFGVVRFTLGRVGKGSSALPRFMGRATSSGAGLETIERMIGEIRKMPQELWPAIQSHWCHSKSFASMGRHLASLPASVACLNGNAPLNIPVTLIVGAQSRTQWPSEELPLISSDLTYLVAQKSGHWIQLDEPALVVNAVRELVTRAREGERSLR